MLVEEVMQAKVIVLRPGDTVLHALQAAKAHRIRHLPVVEGEKLVGIVSDRDLRDVSPSVLCPERPELLETTRVEDIMKTRVITAHPLDTMDEAARLMYEHKIGCLPVVRGDEMVGIVTETDLLRALVELMGGAEPGSSLRVEVPHRPGSLAQVADIIQRHGVNLLSVLITPAKDSNNRILMIRVHTIAPQGLIRDINAAGYQVVWPLSLEAGR
ncbi:acetoin utilization protein AcuB [Clostridiales bacterium PH28_bin88]|nr:acetoin utilization protein AcuB [Clostridiales bacterium PH28_bin88]